MLRNTFRVAQVAQVAASRSQARGMATLKDLSDRLTSVKSVSKITSSMKMVSAAKFSRAERALKQGKATGDAARALVDTTGMAVEAGNAQVLLAFSSDRGMCGGIHSGISKLTKATAAASGAAEKKIVVIGDKSRGQLARTHAQDFLLSFNEYGRKPPGFDDAAGVSMEVINSGFKFDSISLIYNKFVNAAKYEPSTVTLPSGEAIAAKEELSKYDDIGSDDLRCYSEFNLATNVFYCMLECSASEQSSRMAAMENATNNAGDMISKMTLTFNRRRQALITTNLIEIISGAAALE